MIFHNYLLNSCNVEICKYNIVLYIDMASQCSIPNMQDTEPCLVGTA